MDKVRGRGEKGVGVPEIHPVHGINLCGDEAVLGVESSDDGAGFGGHVGIQGVIEYGAVLGPGQKVTG